MKTKFSGILTLLLAFVVQLTFAQEKTISGTVSDDSGLPLPGATVLVKGTSTGTSTDFDGKYLIRANQESTLVFSFVGYTTKEIKVDASNSINVQLSEDAAVLEEVVITALGISKDPSKLAYSVSKVDTEEVIKSNEADFVNALAGKTTGIQINSSSALAGGSSRILIRGVSSLNFDNSPLYVIDGVPVSNSESLFDARDSDQALFYGSAPGGTINIAPDQIKNISILKGAAASALYGSRAANGVIVIETHKGRNNTTPTVNFKTTTTLSTIIEPEYQKEYAQGIGGVFYTGEPGNQTSLSWGPKASENGIQTYNPYEFFNTGTTFDNSLSVQGGSDKSSYYASVGIYNQKGTVPTNSFDRYSFLLNSSHQITNKISIDSKISYTNTENDRPFEGNGRTSIMNNLSSTPISYNSLPATDEDGAQRAHTTSRNNSYYLLKNAGFLTTGNRFQPSLALSYKIKDWIQLKAISSLDFDLYDSKSYENAGLFGTYSSGRILETNRKSRDFNTDVILTIDKDFSEKITADYLVGYNLFDRKNSTLYSEGTSFIIPSFYDLSNATSLQTDELTLEKRSYSFYAQANLGYDNLLFLTLTGRNDWSSSLPSNKNSFFYYSGSLGLDLAKVFQVQGVLNRAMLRGSYSRVGNDAPEYATQTSYIKANPGDGQRGNINFPFQGVGSYVQSAIKGNPELTPEFTNEYEISLDLQLFKNRVGIEAGYYDRRSEDQIFEVPLASSTGFNSIYKNAGAIQNKGVELSLNLTPIQTEDFKWDLNLNYSKNESEVLELADGVESVRLAGFTNPGIFIRKGESYGVIWTTLYKRNDDGQLLLDDDGYVQVDNIGNAGTVTPDWTGGLSTSFEYKAFKLSAVMDMRVGGKMYNLDEYYKTYYGTSILTADREKDVIINGVIESTGAVNTIPVKKDFTYWSGYAGDEEFVQKTDYIKLRNVTFSYTVPTAFISKTGFKAVSISASGRNLWIKSHDSFTGSDPELSLYGSGNGQGITNFQIPSNKSYSLTLNLTF
ncbi:SusC/RagA family TonB-linked outer membrane protein [Mariniflexile litorale]|uniref:SusC/RagA family TonB-linked outer membrane protein n=1 Tax=Mariniflexile litorale TaxID=3045158 RepID=A0AAU7E9Q2_9FLAO|nr:SusC/RagA family TonB-linked outer membrane protein [Mariniflexile sp. KMM 9835]MDQ8212523.1 SusC/RagA family TonB-linked outer membrane protein [Mariniflexile sp. KMM 9835]